MSDEKFLVGRSIFEVRIEVEELRVFHVGDGTGPADCRIVARARSRARSYVLRYNSDTKRGDLR